MATTKKKQSAKQKRIMIASILIAAAITVGGTFAWFTSSDSVTNRLTASADYGVSVTETFTPPSTWVPGQEVEKDVAAVNTGNVSAFVKLTLSNKIQVKYEEAESTTYDTSQSSGTATYSNPTAAPTNAVVLNSTETENEVRSLQAGGVLVYTTSSANDDKNAVSAVNVATGVGTGFTPTGTGLYIFRRAVKDDISTSETYEYVGYYCIVADSTKTYYKIKLADTNGVTVGTDKKVSSAKFSFVVSKTDETNTTPTFEYESAVSTGDASAQHPARIKATYSRADGTADDIIIYINLKNIKGDSGDAGDNWTYGGLNTGTTANTQAYFYLNKILEPGTTSADLVDSITLGDKTSKDASTTSAPYKYLTYDLNVKLDSIQAYYDKDGNIDTTESAEIAKSWTENKLTESSKEVNISEVSGKTGSVTWNYTKPTE